MTNDVKSLMEECERLNRIIDEQNKVIDEQFKTILHLDMTIREYERERKYKRL